MVKEIIFTFDSVERQQEVAGLVLLVLLLVLATEMKPLVKGLFYGETEASTTIMDKSKVIDLIELNKFAFITLVKFLAARGRFA